MGSGLDGVGQFSRASWSVFAENSQYDVDASSILSVGSFELYAEVAQLVEHDLAKVGVAGSSPVFRSELGARQVLAVRTVIATVTLRPAQHLKIRQNSLPSGSAIVRQQ